MPRYKLTIEYQGGPFAGWQRQKDAMSVQQVLEEAISKLVSHDVLVYGSGRTDAGVHATAMVAHVDIDRDIGLDASVAWFYRPLAIQNIVFSLSAAALIPGDGFETLFGDDVQYSVLANLVLSY